MKEVQKTEAERAIARAREVAEALGISTAEVLESNQIEASLATPGTSTTAAGSSSSDSAIHQTGGGPGSAAEAAGAFFFLITLFK